MSLPESVIYKAQVLWTADCPRSDDNRETTWPIRPKVGETVVEVARERTGRTHPTAHFLGNCCTINDSHICRSFRPFTLMQNKRRIWWKDKI